MADATSWVIGSATDCDIVVDRPQVSRRHCRLTREGDRFRLEDLGSSNGTFVNGTRIREAVPVSPVDAIMLGSGQVLPWPAVAEETMRVIRVGRDPDNEVVLDDTVVSGKHAQVLVVDGRAFIEDLGSTNGTSLGTPDNPVRRAPLSAGDTVYFGSLAVPAAKLLEAGAAGATAREPVLTFRGWTMTLGRDPGCDQVYEHPDVSARHARLAFEGGRIRLADLGSTNGTTLNGRPISRPEPVKAGDLIGLGRLTVRLVFDDQGTNVMTLPAAGEAGDNGTGNRVEPIRADPSAAYAGSDEHGITGRIRAILARRWADPWGTALAVAQGPVLGLLIAWTLGRGAAVPLSHASWPGVADALAKTCLALAVAAVWIGGMVGLGEAPTGRGDDRDRAPTLTAIIARVLALGPLVLIGVLLLLAIVQGSGALAGPWPAAFGLLALAGVVGLALGLFVSALVRDIRAALGLLAVLTLGMALVNAGVFVMGPRAHWLRPIAKITPAYWAFEGVLLFESEPRATWRPGHAAGGTVDPGGAKAASRLDEPPRDMAERAFPVDTERSGVQADVAALGAMLVGLLGLLAAVPPSRRR